MAIYEIQLAVKQIKICISQIFEWLAPKKHYFQQETFSDNIVQGINRSGVD